MPRHEDERFWMNIVLETVRAAAELREIARGKVTTVLYPTKPKMILPRNLGIGETGLDPATVDAEGLVNC